MALRLSVEKSFSLQQKAQRLRLRRPSLRLPDEVRPAVPPPNHATSGSGLEHAQHGAICDSLLPSASALPHCKSAR